MERKVYACVGSLHLHTILGIMITIIIFLSRKQRIDNLGQLALVEFRCQSDTRYSLSRSGFSSALLSGTKRSVLIFYFYFIFLEKRKTHRHTHPERKGEGRKGERGKNQSKVMVVCSLSTILDTSAARFVPPRLISQKFAQP